MRVMLAIAAIAVSFVLAFLGMYLTLKLHTATPGILFVDFLAQYGPVPILWGFSIQMAVDFVFWFVVMYAIYWLIRHRKDA